jgi:hypothetical protein
MLATEPCGRVPTLRKPDGRLVQCDWLYRVRVPLPSLSGGGLRRGRSGH